MTNNSNSFDPSALDEVLDDAEEVHEIAERIEEDKAMIESNQAVDVNRVYGELEGLINIGNDILKNAQYAVEMDPTAEGVLGGAASMLNAVKDTVKEFTKVHLQNLKFQQQMELEKLKQQGREKLVEMRHGEDDEENTHLVPFNQEEIIKGIVDQEKKAKLRKPR